MTKIACFAAFWAVFVCSIAAQKTSEAARSIFFETDSHALTAEAEAALGAFADDLREKADFEIAVEAFADDRGSVGHNRALAERRAAAVADFLARKNVRARSVSTVGRGEIDAKAAAETLDETRRQNRRVDVRATIFEFERMADLLARLAQTVENAPFSAEFDPKTAQNFTTDRGTEVAVPADAFETLDGKPPVGSVRLRLREAFEPSEFLLFGLTTATEKGELLQTAGMVETRAETADGQLLRLRNDKKITLGLPSTGKIDPAMQLFYGQNHPQPDPTGRELTVWRAVPMPVAGPRFLDEKAAPPTQPLPDFAVDFLKKMRFPEPEKRAKPTFSTTLFYPKKPAQPTKPLPLTARPEREKVVFKPQNLRERLFSADKKAALEEAIFQKKWADWEISKTKHEARAAAFEAEKAAFDAKIAAFETEKAAWKLEATGRLRQFLEFEKAEQLRGAAIILNQVAAAAPSIRLGCSGRAENLADAMARRARLLRISKVPKKQQLFYVGDREHPTAVPVGAVRIEPTGEAAFAEDLKVVFQRAQMAAPGADQLLTNSALIDTIMAQPDFAAMAARAAEAAAQKCLATGDVGAMRRYVFEIGQLGWSNVDKLAKFKPSESMAVEISEKDAASITVDLPKMRAAVPMSRLENGQYRSNLKLPRGEKARVVALKIAGGMAFLAVSEFVVGVGKAPKLEYEKMPIGALRQALERLNS